MVVFQWKKKRGSLQRCNGSKFPDMSSSSLFKRTLICGTEETEEQGVPIIALVMSSHLRTTSRLKTSDALNPGDDKMGDVGYLHTMNTCSNE